MPSQVFWGSPRQARLRAEETLPAKLDLIINHLHIRDRVKDETVAIKIHTGNNIGYSTAHPVFVRKLVQAVRDGGGRPAGASFTREDLASVVGPAATALPNTSSGNRSSRGSISCSQPCQRTR